MSVGETGDLLGGGGEAMTGLAGPDPQPGRQVGHAGSGRSEEDHVLLPDHEIERPEVGDRLSLHGPLMVEAEVFLRLAGGERGGPDPSPSANGGRGRPGDQQAGGLETALHPVQGAYLHALNPAGFGAMLVASAVSITAFLGALGPCAQAFSTFLACGLSLVLCPLIGRLTKGRFHLERTNTVNGPGGGRA